MKEKLILTIFILTTIFCIRCNSGDMPAINDFRPNLIFILVDDLGYYDLGFNGSLFYETPNIDKLASQSIVFKNSYSASPVCSPSRAAILTGKHPNRLGITNFTNSPSKPGLPESKDFLDLKEYTIAEALRDQGYKTAFIGKWHLGPEGFGPENQGFDINIGGCDAGRPQTYYSPYNLCGLKDGPPGEYLTDRLTNEALSIIEDLSGDPFFLMLSYYSVHVPIEGNQSYVPYFEQKSRNLTLPQAAYEIEHAGHTLQNQVDVKYASMVYALDKNVGEILNYLESSKQAKNTVVIFCSDNGGLSTWPRTKFPPTSNSPLRAGKGWCYEGGIRVPFMIRTPDMIPGNSDKLTVGMDIFPTILELLGVKNQLIPSDGESLVPALCNLPDEHSRILFWHYPHIHGSTAPPEAAIRFNHWKLLDFYDTRYHEGEFELYNLENDIEEQDNLAGRFPELTRTLRTYLDSLHKETGSLMPY